MTLDAVAWSLHIFVDGRLGPHNGIFDNPGRMREFGPTLRLAEMHSVVPTLSSAHPQHFLAGSAASGAHRPAHRANQTYQSAQYANRWVI